MKICFPVSDAKSFSSEVYGHFGSAPAFLIIDTETNETITVLNCDQTHARGTCSPLRALSGKKVDCVVVGGIGGGALMKLNQAGVTVYKAVDISVQKNLDLLKAGNLPVFQPGNTCGGHTASGGCSH